MNPWLAYYDSTDNRRSRPKRAAFWNKIIELTGAESVLEVGCGDGLNLEHIHVPLLVGADTYEAALHLAMDRLHWRVNIGWAQLGDFFDRPSLVRASATNLQFHLAYLNDRERKTTTNAFDLAFTCTTLQHLGDADCEKALGELVRVSRRWVLVMEYEAPTRTPVYWRGDPDGIIKRPYGLMLEQHMPIVERGFLARDPDGFDDIVWTLGRKE